MKLSIVFLLGLYYDYVYVKGILIFLVIFCYQAMLNYFKPYKNPSKLIINIVPVYLILILFYVE